MILIIGSNGQLGREMQKALIKRNLDFKAFDYPDIDITKKEDLYSLISAVNPTAVVNCAAYTNVDKAEQDYDAAYQINAVGPKSIAEICHEKGIEMVQVSTDYVFSGEPIMENGKPRPYIESDKCEPQTVYGKTKLEGEIFAQSAHDKVYLLRTAWLYGDGNNFVRTMFRLAETKKSLTIVNDQIGSPTSTVDLANAICELLGTGAYGLYHATCEGQCSWYDFSKKIFEIKGIDIEVIPVTSEEYASLTKRPKWSVLENKNLTELNKNVFRNWEDSLKEYLKF